MISTHAPRTGSDYDIYTADKDYLPFQPTLPARGATAVVLVVWGLQQYFNPRSPHGERLRYEGNIANRITFQPTLPARGATTSIL